MINDATGFSPLVTDQWKGKGECVCMGAHEHLFLKSKISCFFVLASDIKMR